MSRALAAQLPGACQRPRPRGHLSSVRQADGSFRPTGGAVEARLVLGGLDEATAFVEFDEDCGADIILGYDWLRAHGGTARPPSKSATKRRKSSCQSKAVEGPRVIQPGSDLMILIKTPKQGGIDRIVYALQPILVPEVVARFGMRWWNRSLRCSSHKRAPRGRCQAQPRSLRRIVRHARRGRAHATMRARSVACSASFYDALCARDVSRFGSDGNLQTGRPLTAYCRSCAQRAIDPLRRFLAACARAAMTCIYRHISAYVCVYSAYFVHICRIFLTYICICIYCIYFAYILHIMCIF
jgi:hypothetical protein